MVCKNCKRLLPQQIKYCNGCGGKVIKNRLTMRNLFEDFAYRYLNVDNRFYRTFKHLFSKPEAVIESYINGTRKRYVDVISYFAIAITLTGFYVYVLTNFYPDAMTENVLSKYTPPQNAKAQAEQLNFMTKYTSLMMMCMIPFYAFLAKIVFFNKKKFNFTELIVVFLYVQAQISIITAVATITLLVLKLDFMIISLILSPLMFLYYAYCLKRLYNLSIPGIILRSMGFIGLFTGVSIMFTIGLVAWMFTTESGQEYAKSQADAVKAAQKPKVELIQDSIPKPLQPLKTEPRISSDSIPLLP